MIENDITFKSFVEYWHFVRNLSDNQRKTIFDSLSKNQKKVLNSSYISGSWEDVICRNAINRILDGLKKEYNIDIIAIKAKVLSGKSAYIPKGYWEALNEKISEYKYRHIKFILSGIEVIECEYNEDVLLVLSSLN